MKQLFYSVTVLCLILNACQKSAEPLTIDPPPISCEIVPNDTLMITYPCDGQINFIPDSFSWKFGVIGEQLEGFVELHISKPNQPYGLYSGFGWSDLGNPKEKTSLTGAAIALLANTKYEWFMVLRHDGNNLYYKTSIQTFTTGGTGFTLPTVFQTFAGTYAVQDTFKERIQVWDTQHTYHLEDLPPVAFPSTTVTLESIPGEIFTLSGQDTVTYIMVGIGQEAPNKVRINHNGIFQWSDGNYYTPTSISGKVIGDSIVCYKTRSSNMVGTFSSHAYKGKRG